MSLGGAERIHSTRTRKIGQLVVNTYASKAIMGAAAAHDIAAALKERLANQKGVRMVFAAAPSQSAMLEQLCSAPDIDWRRVTAFHMDEYLGLPENAPQRFATWLDRHLFDRAPFAQVHHIRPGPDPETDARRYQELLSDAPIDFVCLGIGVNGHIAFNDPPVADFDDVLDVKVVELDQTCRQQQVDDDCFDKIEDVPSHAITLTVPRLLRAGRMFCVVPGSLKRFAVDAALNGPISTTCPASILRTHPDCTFYLDEDADPDGRNN